MRPQPVHFNRKFKHDLQNKLSKLVAKCQSWYLPGASSNDDVAIFTVNAFKRKCARLKQTVIISYYNINFLMSAVKKQFFAILK